MDHDENRDMDVASAVAIMAAMGRFDTEFLIYGSAVQEADGKIYYYATANREKLSQLIREARREERYFMPIISHIERVKVPADMKDEWAAKSKLALIRRMKEQYDAFIPMMQPFFQTKPNNRAAAILEDYQENIDGYFDSTLLQLFWSLVEMSYEAKILSRESYLRFRTWYDKVQHQMSDDPVLEDNITRVYYGFVYEDETGCRKTLVNAQYENIADKWRDKLMNGLLVAPIIKKQYAFKEFSEMPKARQSFSEWLLSVQSEKYMNIVRALRNMEGVIDHDDLQKMAETFAGYDDAVFASAYYRMIWNNKRE